MKTIEIELGPQRTKRTVRENQPEMNFHMIAQILLEEGAGYEIEDQEEAMRDNPASRSLCGFSTECVSFYQPVSEREHFARVIPAYVLMDQLDRHEIHEPIYFGASVAEALYREPDRKALWWFYG